MAQARLFAASIVAIAWSTAAAAQDTSTQLPNTPSPDQAVSTPDPSRAPAVQGTTPTGVGEMPEEVVVTAERRNTSLQRTGVAATVLTGADLAKKGVVNVDDLQFATPSLTVQNFGQGNQFNIRGIGKGTGGAAVNVGVVTYRDGVATFPGYFQSEPYYDIASVEVLRGPQGTFVGQNATGGAVFITEQNPSLESVQGYGQLQYGTFNDVGAQGAINLPISNTLAIRAAFNTEYRSSFYNIRGAYGGHPGRLQSNSGRLSALWEPVDQLRILLKGDYSNIDKGGYVADPAAAPTTPGVAQNDPFTVGNDAVINKARDDFGRIVLNASYTTNGGVVLRSISGYQKGTSTAIGDLDGTSARSPMPLAATLNNFISDERILSEEFNIISPDTGRFTWVLGGYYQHDRGTYPVGRFFTQNAARSRTFTEGFTIKTAAAGFAQAGYEVFDGLQVQGGIRYSRSSSQNIGRLRVVPVSGPVIIAPTDSKYDDDAVTGKVALNWTVNPNHFLYAFVATGYKSGGLNIASTQPSTQSFRPERVTDFEIGWKATLFDGHLRTQLGGYYNRYKNFQVRISDPLAPQTSPFQNVPSITKIYGVEASAQGSFGRFAVDVAAGYSHAELGTFFAADPRLIPNPPCNTLTGPAGAKCFDLTGNPPPYAPRFTGNVGAQYSIPIQGGVTLTPRINYARISESFGTLFAESIDPTSIYAPLRRADRLVPRNLINAQVTLAGDVWSATGYLTNGLDQTYIAATNGNLRYAAPPRQYGIRITRNF